VQQSHRNLRRLVTSLRIGDDHRELVSADPSKQIALAGRRGEPIRDPSQHSIPGAISQCIIDGLELIEIDDQYGQPHARTLCRRDGSGEMVLEGMAVRQTREKVVRGCVVLAFSRLVEIYRQSLSLDRMTNRALQ
jgi:hypothetical protein